MIDLALDFAFGCIGLALVLCTWRLIKGPEAPDRVLALDTLYVNVVALVILLGMRLQTALFFEAALLIALLGFVGIVTDVSLLFVRYSTLRALRYVNTRGWDRYGKGWFHRLFTVVVRTEATSVESHGISFPELRALMARAIDLLEAS